MRGNFKIYPVKILGIIEEYTPLVTELEQKIKQLETVKNNMDGASYGEVKGALSEIETQLIFQCKSLKELRDGLRSIILAYLKTERKIEDLRMGAHKDLSEDKSTNPGMEGDDEKDNLQEFLEFIKSELNETGNNINKEYEKVNFLFEELFKDPNAFIPQNIRNEGVLLFYEILRQYNGISEKRIEKNALINHELLCESNDILKSGEYIENQSNWGDVQFGLLKEHNMRYSGCGIIATYNALLALGEDASGKTMVDLISSYERDGAVINGEFGTAPGAIEDYFKKNDYDVLMTASKDKNTINNLGEKSDTIIVTAYNNQQKITSQIHTVSITKEKDGTYSVHNTYNYNKDEKDFVSRDGFFTLQDAINGMASDATDRKSTRLNSSH